jgi:DNA-binding MarR family transcriptional regulator
MRIKPTPKPKDKHVLCQAAMEALTSPTDVPTLALQLNISAHEDARLLNDLEKNGHVRRLPRFNPPLFMAHINNGPLPDQPKKRGRPRRGADAMILHHLETHGPSSVTRIVEVTGLPRGTVIHVLKRLEANGQVIPSPHVKRVRGKVLIWQLPGAQPDAEMIYNHAIIQSRPRPAWADQSLIPAIAMVDGTRRVVWLSPTEAYRIAEEIKEVKL